MLRLQGTLVSWKERQSINGEKEHGYTLLAPELVSYQIVPCDHSVLIASFRSAVQMTSDGKAMENLRRRIKPKYKKNIINQAIHRHEHRFFIIEIKLHVIG